MMVEIIIITGWQPFYKRKNGHKNFRLNFLSESKLFGVSRFRATSATLHNIMMMMMVVVVMLKMMQIGDCCISVNIATVGQRDSALRRTICTLLKFWWERRLPLSAYYVQHIRLLASNIIFYQSLISAVCESHRKYVNLFRHKCGNPETPIWAIKSQQL